MRQIDRVPGQHQTSTSRQHGDRFQQLERVIGPKPESHRATRSIMGEASPRMGSKRSVQ